MLKLIAALTGLMFVAVAAGAMLALAAMAA